MSGLSVLVFMCFGVFLTDVTQIGAQILHRNLIINEVQNSV